MEAGIIDAGEETIVGRTLSIARRIAARHGRSIDLHSGDPLLGSGLDSLDVVDLMLAVEAEFDIMIPATHLSAQSFHSVEAISRMVDAVHAGAA